MKPILPRQLLWTEIRTIDEFINDEVSNFGLYHIVKDLPPELFPGERDMVKLFNEMYYLLTRIYYEKPKAGEYLEYQKCIINDIGWKGSADLVFIMMYTYIRINDSQTENTAVAEFMKYIEQHYWWSYYWPHFNNFRVSEFGHREQKFNPKVPHPVPAKDLIGVKMNFETITLGYKLESLQEVVNLWSDEWNKKIIAKILLDDVSKYSSSYITNLDDIIDWLDAVIHDENKKQVIELQKKIVSLTAEIDKWHNAFEEETKRTAMCESLQKQVDEQKKIIEKLKSEHKSDEAFNSQTKQPCFTNRQMGILMTAVGMLTEKDNPIPKTRIGDIVEIIAGYSSKTVNQNMKGRIPDKDTEVVVKVLEDKFPNLAAAVRNI